MPKLECFTSDRYLIIRKIVKTANSLLIIYSKTSRKGTIDIADLRWPTMHKDVEPLADNLGKSVRAWSIPAWTWRFLEVLSDDRFCRHLDDPGMSCCCLDMVIPFSHLPAKGSLWAVVGVDEWVQIRCKILYSRHIPLSIGNIFFYKALPIYILLNDHIPLWNVGCPRVDRIRDD